MVLKVLRALCRQTSLGWAPKAPKAVIIPKLTKMTDFARKVL
jgi:hypothetical protein